MIRLNKLSFVFLVCFLTVLQVSVAFPPNEKRIVGGDSTTIDTAPYLVQIRNNNNMLCSGALVTDTHVVTAAHCFDNDPKRLSVVGGASKITENGSARSKVTNIVIPTDYNNETYTWDIAVIKLKKPLSGQWIEKISLDCDGFKIGDPVRIVGWGKTDEDADSIPIGLQAAEVEIVDREECKKTYRFRRPLSDTMFCAAAEGKDSCNGDSGGPVLVNKQFCGVVSWGIGCAQDDLPGVYTDMKRVREFIESAIHKLK